MTGNDGRFESGEEASVSRRGLLRAASATAAGVAGIAGWAGAARPAPPSFGECDRGWVSAPYDYPVADLRSPAATTVLPAKFADVDVTDTIGQYCDYGEPDVGRVPGIVANF